MKKALLTIAVLVIAAVVWSQQVIDDESSQVVKTQHRVMRVVVEYDMTGNVVGVSGDMQQLKIIGTELIWQRPVGNKFWYKATLQAAGSAQSNLVVRLEQLATWAKANWNQ